MPVAGSCSGWGGSKYRTFDGTNYSFRGNCTHVLVREIQPRFGNLSVLLNSYYCAAAAAPASCPRALVIRYGPTEVTLSTSTDASGREQSLVRAGGPAGGRPSGSPRGRLWWEALGCTCASRGGAPEGPCRACPCPTPHRDPAGERGAGKAIEGRGACSRERRGTRPDPEQSTRALGWGLQKRGPQ